MLARRVGKFLEPEKKTIPSGLSHPGSQYSQRAITSRASVFPAGYHFKDLRKSCPVKYDVIGKIFPAGYQTLIEKKTLPHEG